MSFISFITAFCGSIQKNNAPPPKKGSIYLPEQEGICFIIRGISFDFPPLYLIIGFIFAIFPTKLQLFSHKAVNQAGIYPSGSIGRREWLFRSFSSGADIIFSRICFGSTMSRKRSLHSRQISLLIQKRGRRNCLRGFASRGLRLFQRWIAVWCKKSRKGSRVELLRLGCQMISYSVYLDRRSANSL